MRYYAQLETIRSSAMKRHHRAMALASGIVVGLLGGYLFTGFALGALAGMHIGNQVVTLLVGTLAAFLFGRQSYYDALIYYYRRQAVPTKTAVASDARTADRQK